MELDRTTVTWILGGLALAGGAYFLYRRRQDEEAAAKKAQEEAQNVPPAEPSNLVHFPAAY